MRDHVRWVINVLIRLSCKSHQLSVSCECLYQINSIQPFHLSPKDKRYRSSTQSSFSTAVAVQAILKYWGITVFLPCEILAAKKFVASSADSVSSGQKATTERKEVKTPFIVTMTISTCVTLPCGRWSLYRSLSFSVISPWYIPPAHKTSSEETNREKWINRTHLSIFSRLLGEGRRDPPGVVTGWGYDRSSTLTVISKPMFYHHYRHHPWFRVGRR